MNPMQPRTEGAILLEPPKTEGPVGNTVSHGLTASRLSAHIIASMEVGYSLLFLQLPLDRFMFGSADHAPWSSWYDPRSFRCVPSADGTRCDNHPHVRKWTPSVTDPSYLVVRTTLARDFSHRYFLLFRTAWMLVPHHGSF